MSNEYETPVSQIDKLMSSINRTKKDEDEAFAIYEANYKLCSPSCADCCGDWRVLCCRPKTIEDIHDMFDDGIQILLQATNHIKKAKEEGNDTSEEYHQLVDIVKKATEIAHQKLKELIEYKKATEETTREYFCEYGSNCKGGPYKRNEVWYDAKADCAVCKVCWGGEKPDFAE